MKVLLLLLLLTVDPPKYPTVYIEWIDIIATDNGWRDKETLDSWIVTEPDTVRQVGLLYLQNEEYVVLIDSYISNDIIGAATKIPKCNIVKFEVIKH